MSQKKLKVDPVTQARQAVQMFENMQNALEFVSIHVKEMISFNLAHAKKHLASLEEKENGEFQISENQTKIFK